MNLLIMIISLTISISALQDETINSSNNINDEFDFWLGDWNLEWQTKNGETVAGKNSITKILDGFVIKENFTTLSEKPFKGVSLTSYNQKEKLWMQTWVDNKGGYLDFKGSWFDDRMILRREITNGNGQSVIQRMVFYEIEKDSLKWNWERSTDNGNSWEVLWKISYRRNTK